MRSLAILLLVSASPAHAERIKLGTMAPKGSTWEAMLKEMGQKWSDASDAKIFGWDGDPASIEAWRAGGFKPVVMSSTDIVPSLQTGLIDTVALAPLYAFTSRMFEKAKYMLDLPWAVLTGATVVKKDVWEKIPADLRPKLLEIAHEYSKKIADEVRRMDADALTQMKAQGLVVVQPQGLPEFKKAALATWTVIRGKVVPADVFDEVKKLVDEAHAQGK